MDKNELLKILRSSIKEFYARDFYLIDDMHKVHEQAIAHRIAHYFENIVAKNTPTFYVEYNFDVEYNKNFNDPKFIFLQCFQCPDKNCSCRNYIEPKTKSRPDFLIHKRGSNEQNCLVVEFKKWDSKPEDIQYDINKLKYFTCSKGEYKYLLGCLVLLKENSYKIEIFETGKKFSSKTYEK